MTKKLKELLLSVYKSSFDDQKKILNENIIQWMGKKHKQVNDILVIGFKK